MSLPTRSFDPARYLTDAESIAAYLDEALATGDAAFIVDAIGVVARAQGMSDLARKSGLSRENLYRAFSASGRPEFATVVRVLSALGIRLSAAPDVVREQQLEDA